MTSRGVFVAFEGADFTGKSTQAARLADHLGALLTREPGGTRLGERVRDLLLDPLHDEMADRAEALLYAAARAQHVAEVIRPALDSGRTVVTDRFVASSLAYQAAGRGLDLDTVRSLSEFAVDGTWPDLNVLIEVPAEVRRTRAAATPDRLEGAGDAFHDRVAAAFAAFAAADPEHWAVVDGSGPVDEVAQRVRAVVADRLGGRRRA
ncbi:MAG TPA: dTMP kinase [Acidimicrobiales bacterium]|nr:dTMP kinase [Acidimicrobiales bacterium]